MSPCRTAILALLGAILVTGCEKDQDEDAVVVVDDAIVELAAASSSPPSASTPRSPAFPGTRDLN
jgi:hypothetical protein